MSLKSENYNYTEDFENNTSFLNPNGTSARSRQQRDVSKATSNKNVESNQRAGGGMSSNELKARLLQVVKNKGIYDVMKSQIRNKLVFELNPNLEKIKSQEAGVKIKSNLALSTINSLIIDHLKTNQYEYSLSVFMPECGINLADAYSLQDILHILKISPESKLYSEISSSPVIKSNGLLWYLMNYFCKHYVTHDSAVQTDFDGAHNIALSLDLKLKNVDKQFNEISSNFSNKLSFEEKVVAYQKKLDEEYKKDYDKKIKEFQEIELARMRVEEREKQRVEMQTYRLELEHAYKKKSESLKQKEKTLDEMLKQKNQADEREIFLQRQHLLEEIKQLREKETDQRRNTESQLKLIEIEASRFDRLEEEIKKRETQVQVNEKEIENRLRDERERIKLELERVYAEREFVLQSIEIKNKQDMSNIEIEKAHLDRLKREFHDQQMRLSETEVQMQRVSGELLILRQENDLLKEKLSHCMDYDFVKQENNMLKYKLNISKELIGEKSVMASARTNRSTARRNPASVAASTQQQQQNQSQQGGDNQSNPYPGRYVPQRKRSVTFASEAGPVPNLQLNGNMEDVDENSVMMATEMGADEDVLPQDNEAARNPEEDQNRTSYLDEGERILDEAIERSVMKDNLESYQVVNQELRDLYEMQIYEQRKLHETVHDVKRQVEFLFNGAMLEEDDVKGKRGSNLYDTELVNTSIGFIEGAKDRLKYLETESERIEQGYRDYQHKIKSKYYPINDDQESEFRVIHTTKRDENRKPLDVERFLELTLKANVKAKQIREELETEVAKQNSISKSRHIEQDKIDSMRKVEDLLRAVSMPVVDGGRVSSPTKIDIRQLKNQLLSDESELTQFKMKHTIPAVSKLQDMDSTDETSEIQLIKKPVSLNKSFDSESRASSPAKKSIESSPKRFSSVNNFLYGEKNKERTASPLASPRKPKFFQRDEDDSEGQQSPTRSPPKASNTKHIKIEYSTSSSEDDDKKKKPSTKIETQKRDDSDEDDDFF